MKAKILLILIFIISGCSIKTHNQTILKEDEEIVESSQDILDELNREYFPILFPKGEVAGKNKDEMKKVFVNNWTSYFIHYYVLLKTNFDYDKAVKSGIYKEGDLTVIINHDNISVPQSPKFYYNSCQLKMSNYQETPYYKKLLYGCEYHSLYLGMEKEIYQLSLRNIKPDSEYIIKMIENRGKEAFDSYYKRYAREK